ncbi:MAG: hypothetical protein ACRBK7_12930, partial [Acidimicrobiales bacterium]
GEASGEAGGVYLTAALCRTPTKTKTELAGLFGAPPVETGFQVDLLSHRVGTRWKQVSSHNDASTTLAGWHELLTQNGPVRCLSNLEVFFVGHRVDPGVRPLTPVIVGDTTKLDLVSTKVKASRPNCDASVAAQTRPTHQRNDWDGEGQRDSCVEQGAHA